LTKLLLNLKEDMQKKAAYLKYLKVSAKFIEACECDKKVHAYCLTAQVTRTQKIQCEFCNAPFRYFIKKEKVCNSKLMKLVVGYILTFILSIMLTVGLVILDGWLKFKNVSNDPEKLE
jgi:hypothetical protein